MSQVRNFSTSSGFIRAQAAHPRTSGSSALKRFIRGSSAHKRLIRLIRCSSAFKRLIRLHPRTSGSSGSSGVHPAFIRSHPAFIRFHPALIRRSSGLIRRSSGLIRRSSGIHPVSSGVHPVFVRQAGVIKIIQRGVTEEAGIRQCRPQKLRVSLEKSKKKCSEQNSNRKGCQSGVIQERL